MHFSITILSQEVLFCWFLNELHDFCKLYPNDIEKYIEYKSEFINKIYEKISIL